jgi:hypothetical protein
MTRIYIFLALFFCFCNSFAQNTPLMVQLDNQQKPYLNHTIGMKENFYSIGRMYNISPRVFAPYNGLDLSSGLSIGQIIKIPLNETNFWQKGSRKGNETVVAIYHSVQAKETFQSVSNLYHIDKSNIISWNNISGEKMNVGDKVIIGFLKVDKNLSPLAAQGMGPRTEPNLSKPQEKGQATTIKTEPSAKEERKEVIKPTEVKKEEEKKEIISTNLSEPKPTKVLPDNSIEYIGNGYFENDFLSQISNKKSTETTTLSGGSFKSTSGWSDGKFYILIDGVEKGKIVKVTNPLNNKSIYAKVLASISETKPGAKELFLISNATVAQLGVQGNIFDLEISK